MKKLILSAIAIIVSVAGYAQSKVYFSKEITPESLVKIYKALGKEPKGKVAVKISTGEPGGHNFLSPALISDLVKDLNGTIVECNTAYKGKRYTAEESLQAARDHGFCDIAEVDILDSTGSDTIPVRDKKHLKYNLIGKNLKNYDFIVNLAHFKGHAMGGFGGVLKNQSIGISSREGKAYIHSAGVTADSEVIWDNIAPQDDFLESMAAAAQSVADMYGDNIVYINVLNNLSVDCDCNSNPADPKMKDIGIMASLDPVALDQASVDMVFNMKPSAGNDNAPLIERIQSRHGTHTIDYAEEIGLGSKKYEIVDIDKK